MTFRLVQELSCDGFAVAVTCRVLSVSRSGYYQWRDHPLSKRAARDGELLPLIERAHYDSRGSYGAPRVHAELRLGHGIRIGRKRVAEHPTATGKVYCAAVLDCFTRRVVRWSIADHMRTELVVDALEMARWQRRPEPGTIVHADRGSQYTSWLFGHRLRQAGLLGSMGRVASSVDNGLMESFWSTMQRELLDRRSWTTQAELGSAIFEWIEGFYNPRRRHSALGYLSPADYEQEHTTTVLSA